jgi:hypothetical protein
MTRKSIGTLAGLAVLAFAACGGSGYAHDYSDPEADAPTGPGAPSDPSAPPVDTTTPPYGDVAPPPPGSGAGGTTGTGGGGTGGGGKGGMPMDCTELCDRAELECMGMGVGDGAECPATCQPLEAECFPQVRAAILCAVENDCDAQNPECEEDLVDLVECVGPDV